MSDPIDRQAAVRALERKKDKNAKGDIAGFYNKIIQNDIDTLLMLPSAQPEVTEEEVKEYCRKRGLCIVDSALLKKYASAQPTIERKKGKWIHNPDPMAGEGFWRCSECGLEAYEYVDFCPMCGADMRGESDGRNI